MRVLAASLFLVVMSVGTAVADVPGDSDSGDSDSGDSDSAVSKEKAEKLSELARKLYAAGEFAEAAKVFAESYELDPRPGALFNRGRCLEEAGEKAEAVSAYKAFVKAEPNGDATEEANIRILALERQLELERRAGGSGGPDPRTPEVVAPTEEPGRTLRVVGGLVGAAGLGWGIAGIFAGLEASSINDEFVGRPRMQWSDGEIERFEEGEAANRRAMIFMSVGAVAVVTGGVLYYLGHRRSGRVDVTPSVTADSVGASASFLF